MIFVLSGGAQAAVPDVPSVTLSIPATTATTRLDGDWWFAPADQGAFAPQTTDAAAVDAMAARLPGLLAQGGYVVSSPQFLNRIRWWLPNVSLEYERQEVARMAAFPFDAEATQTGWYVKRLRLPPVPAGTVPPEVNVTFEGVAMVSRVYVNGSLVGGHTGMFGEFTCRLTSRLRWGADNFLAVHVQRGVDASDGANDVVEVAVTVPVTRDMLTALNAGMFGGFGRGPRAKFMGIWQPATLKISQAGGRIADVFFNPRLDGHSIEFTLENPGAVANRVTVEYQLRDIATGEVLAREALPPRPLAAGSSDTFTTKRDGLAPKLWTPDTPNLYELTVALRGADGRVLDTWSHRVGYRTVAVRGRQVILNGHPYWSRGANMPPYGYRPNSPEVARGFLRSMKAGNTVITRSHGNPWNDLWLSAADEIGIGVSAEGVRPWALMSRQAPPPAPILRHWKDEQLESMRQYRNHPSILFYCLSNEGLQGDSGNPQKLAIMRDIIDAMRALDPSRPIFQTSGDPDEQHIADLTDIHSYWGWYESSSFVNDYSHPRRGLTIVGDDRAFINQECAVPYQMIDTGAVHPQYVGYYSGQAWVGDIGIYGDNPDYFSAHVAAEAKVKAEKLRYQRDQVPTAGTMLFNNATWISGTLSRPVAQWKPFPVWQAVREAFQPVLVALGSTERVLYAGAPLATRVYVVNDSTDFSDLAGLALTADFLSPDGKVIATHRQALGDVPYYATRSWPLALTLPGAPASADGHPSPVTLRLRLSDAAGRIVSENPYALRIAARAWAVKPARPAKVAQAGLSASVLAALTEAGLRPLALDAARDADVVVLGAGAAAVTEKQARAALKPGGRLLVLEQGARADRFAADVVRGGVNWKPAGATARIERGGLRDGASWTTDRDFTFKNIPARLVGRTYVRFRMADRTAAADAPFAALRVGEGRLLVGYDRRATELPAWLRGWRDTGEVIETTGNTTLKLYEQVVRDGDLTVFGNAAPKADAMFTLIFDGAPELVSDLRLAAGGADATQPVEGEFVEMLDWEKSPALYAGLEAMDWKWWGRGEGAPDFVASASHKLRTDVPGVIPLGRYVPPHFYWSGDLKEVYRAQLGFPVFAVKRVWGELVVCDLVISDAIDHDPRAARTLVNLVTQPLPAVAPAFYRP